MDAKDLFTPKRLALALTLLNLLALMGRSLSPGTRPHFLGVGFLAAMGQLLLPLAAGAVLAFYSYVVRRRDKSPRPFSFTWKGYVAALLFLDCIFLSNPWSQLLSVAIVAWLARALWIKARRDKVDPDSWVSILAEIDPRELRRVFGRPAAPLPKAGPGADKPST